MNLHQVWSPFFRPNSLADISCMLGLEHFEKGPITIVKAHLGLHPGSLTSKTQILNFKNHPIESRVQSLVHHPPPWLFFGLKILERTGAQIGWLEDSLAFSFY